MKEMEVDADDQGFSSHSVESHQWIEKQQLPEGTRKVSKSKNDPILKYSLVPCAQIFRDIRFHIRFILQGACCL